eukprot:CAMPEP_0119113028 /NCGR_PEP_ID=MMETSP1180-20130426/42514_1 /TAXON_ID=3052 ORGANISM="Chlamydomonas cf sp, Strain CCMP681" /NCGR_SAMPLE_ID=MMETSP1180 /ASSEMBLY_ACC=CAM_ASM_000741 /LENGTH=95 /DNA_ID=CAMNT_0007100849 /DNA_START=27 /DNA_END=314 /DNA_ORIENTATION=-
MAGSPTSCQRLVSALEALTAPWTWPATVSCEAGATTTLLRLSVGPSPSATVPAVMSGLTGYRLGPALKGVEVPCNTPVAVVSDEGQLKFRLMCRG